MFTKIHNVIIAVKNVEEAAREYTDNFDLQASRSGTESERGIKNALFPIGDAILELIEPLDPEQGPVARFLQTRGEGVYMIGLEVETMDSTIQSLKEKNVRLLGADPESRAKGVPVFIHPQSTKGVLIQLIQRA